MKNGTDQREGTISQKESYVSSKGGDGAVQWDGTLWLRRKEGHNKSYNMLHGPLLKHL